MLRLNWIDSWDGKGNSLGYAMHQHNLQDAMMKQGVEVSKKADIAFHIKPLLHYKRRRRKLNIVYTMYEFSSLPTWWIKKLKNIDLLIVPSQHNKELFERYTDIPIEIAYEGINTDYFQYVNRKFPENRPFCFLWSGATNPRKGWANVIRAWEILMDSNPELHGKVELIMKTTQSWKVERNYTENNVTFDSRLLPFAVDGSGKPTIRKLYYFAHCFLMPSYGEGFCLPLAEAGSTGCPVAYTDWSAPAEWIGKDFGYPIRWKFINMMTVEKKSKLSMKRYFKTQGSHALPTDLARIMFEIYHNYDKALKKGKALAQKIRQEYTWDISASRVIEIINNFVAHAA